MQVFNRKSMAALHAAALSVKKQWCKETARNITAEICEIHYGLQDSFPYHRNGGFWDIWC